MTKHEMQLNSGKMVFLAKDPHFVKSPLNADLSVGCLQIQDTQTQLYYLTLYTGGSVDMQPVR